MDISGIISSIRLAKSIIPEKESASEIRRDLFDSVTGQRISFTPEVGDTINLQLRNCAFSDDDHLTYLTIAVTDPNRPTDLLQLKTDFQYHYLNMYMKRASELSDPLVTDKNFVELGPEDYKIEFIIESTDPPTVQLAFERVEKTLAQIYTEYHNFLQAAYEEHKEKFDVNKEYDNGQTLYKVESDLEPDDIFPASDKLGSEIWSTVKDIENYEPIMISHQAHDYIEFASKAHEGEDDFLN